MPDITNLYIKWNLIKVFTALFSTVSLCCTMGWYANKIMNWKDNTDNEMVQHECRIKAVETQVQKLQTAQNDSRANYNRQIKIK